MEDTGQVVAKSEPRMETITHAREQCFSQFYRASQRWHRGTLTNKPSPVGSNASAPPDPRMPRPSPTPRPASMYSGALTRGAGPARGEGPHARPNKPRRSVQRGPMLVSGSRWPSGHGRRSVDHLSTSVSVNLSTSVSVVGKVRSWWSGRGRRGALQLAADAHTIVVVLKGVIMCVGGGVAPARWARHAHLPFSFSYRSRSLAASSCARRNRRRVGQRVKGPIAACVLAGWVRCSRAG